MDFSFRICLSLVTVISVSEIVASHYFILHKCILKCTGKSIFDFSVSLSSMPCDRYLLKFERRRSLLSNLELAEASGSGLLSWSIYNYRIIALLSEERGGGVKNPAHFIIT